MKFIKDLLLKLMIRMDFFKIQNKHLTGHRDSFYWNWHKNFESYGLKWNKHLNVTFILSYGN